MKSFIKWSRPIVLAALISVPVPANARSTPHLPTNEEVFSWVEDIVEITDQYPEYRRSGTDGDQAVRTYIMSKLKEFGYDTVEEQTYKV